MSSYIIEQILYPTPEELKTATRNFFIETKKENISLEGESWKAYYEVHIRKSVSK